MFRRYLVNEKTLEMIIMILNFVSLFFFSIG